MPIEFRSATDEDAPFILSCRNDQDTRAQSRRQSLLSWDDLRRNRDTFVAELNGNPVGYVQYSEHDLGREISWVVAPAMRRHGLGLRIVKRAAEDRTSLLVAEIKIGNVYSQRIADRCGFILKSSTEAISTWVR